MKKLLETVIGTHFEVDYNRHKKTFKCHTTDSEMIDAINEMKEEQVSFEEIQDYMHSKVFEEIRFEIERWLYIDFE